MFAPMKCVILITQVALQASHRKQADVRTEKSDSRKFALFHFLDDQHYKRVLPSNNILQTFYFQKLF